MPYIGKKPADIIATAVDTTTGTFSGDIDVDGTTNLDVVDIDGAVDMASTLAITGVVTANAGVVVDEMTLDADTLTATDDFILDVAGVINLDSDGGGIYFKDGGTTIAEFINNSSDFELKVTVQDKDIRFRGNDGGVAINALKLDMSDGGAATLNNGLTLTDGNLVVASGHGIDFSANSNASGMSSELLDSYEEGTFTPDVKNTNSSSNFSVRQGNYTRIGRKVFVHFYCDGGNTGTAGTSLVISGLPFAPNSGSGAVIIGHFSSNGDGENNGSVFNNLAVTDGGNGLTTQKSYFSCNLSYNV